MSGQLFSDIKYLNITYSNELQEALLSWSSDFISVDWEAPEVLGRSLLSGVPYNFAKYDVKTSFLVNNWQNMMLLLIFLAIFLVFRVLQALAKSASWIRVVRVFVQNFLLGQLYQTYGEFVLYSIIDWRSSKENNTKLSTLNVAISGTLAFGIIIHLFFHVRLLRNYQKIKVTNNKEELEAFQKKHEGCQFFFRDFKDGSLNQQMFLFYMIIRDLLFSLILATMFEFPIIQTWILLTMNISMLVYLLWKSPFKESVDFAQQIINELITSIVVVSVLIQAIIDYGDSKEIRIRLGKLIITTNIVFNYITLAFMVFKLVLVVKQGYKAYKEYKEEKAASRKVHPFNESIQPTQMSIIQNSTISQIPKGPSMQIMQTEESFFTGFHIDDINKNRSVVARNTIDQTNAPMDDTNLQTLTLETETDRPLVFNRQSTIRSLRPVQKRLAQKLSNIAAIHPIQSSSITLPETEREEIEIAPKASRSKITPINE